MNVTANNWLLPLDGEEYDVPAFREQGLAIRTTWTPTPIFNQMQRDFWGYHFGALSYRELCCLTKQLGVSLAPGVSRNKTNLTLMLCKHFRDMVA